MQVIHCQQTTPEWWEARKGIPTASNFAKIITPAKRQYSLQARKYAYELIAERTDPMPPWVTGRGRPVNAAMQNGTDTEPEARKFYSMQNDCDVQQVGFCLTDDLRFGCSPDGLIGEDGGVEIKCPLLATHAEYLDSGKVPLEYMPQVHGSLIVTGRKWWDFLSYAPGLPSLLIRVVPDDFTDALRKCLERFWTEYQAVAAKLIRSDDDPVGSMADWQQAANPAR